MSFRATAAKAGDDPESRSFFEKYSKSFSSLFGLFIGWKYGLIDRLANSRQVIGI
jgi:hypothetical protein